MDIKSVVKAAVTGAAVGAAANLLGKNLGGVSGALGSLSGFASSLRSSNIPTDADNVAPKEVTTAQSGSGEDPADWRVRLSFPGVMPFINSPLFTPLIEAGGLVFPYTPTISINSTANYT